MSHSPVLKLVAGAGVALTPANGQGVVTIDLTGGVLPVLIPGELLYGAADGSVKQDPGMSRDDATGVVTFSKTVASPGSRLLVLNNAFPGATSIAVVLQTGGVNRGTIAFGSTNVTIGVGAGGATTLQVASATKNLLFGYWQDGDIGLADTAHDLVTTTTTGFVWLPSMPGVPSAAPAHLAGLPHSVPIVVDRTGIALYAYIGGTWQVLGGGGGGGITQLTGDVTAGPGAGAQVATIAANAVTFAKMQTIADQRLVGNVSGGVAVPAEITQAQARTFLGLAAIATTGSATDLVAGTLPAARFPALTGDVTTVAGALATTIAANAVTTAKVVNAAVTYAKIQNVANQRVLGNVSGAPAPPAELTPSDLQTLVGLPGTYVTGSLNASSVTFASGLHAITTDAGFWYDSGTQILTVPALATAVCYNPTGNLNVQGAGSVTVDALTLDLIMQARVGDVTVQASAGAAKLVLTAAGATRLSGLTSNGFVKTSGGIGTLSIDTSTYLTTTSAAATYETIAHAAATYWPIPALTNKRVLYATGAASVGQDAAFQWDTATGVLTLTNASNFTTFAGLWLKDVGGAGNAILRVDSAIRCDVFGPIVGLPFTFTSFSATASPGNEVFRIDDGEIRSVTSAGAMNFRVNGAIELGTGGVVANGSVATVLGSLGPAGASTAVRKWLPITVGGTTYYGPLF